MPARRIVAAHANLARRTHMLAHRVAWCDEGGARQCHGHVAHGAVVKDGDAMAVQAARLDRMA